jgi:cell fate (sporulation/competence/biofilm development) regulator YlbF (YheA/YmcA/DUF963 family)
VDDDVIDDARRLGERLAGHARTKALQKASEAVGADPDARRLQEEYAHALDAMHHAEAEGRPIEPEQKRAVATLGEQIRRSPPLQRLLRAHADFAQMMDGVQRAISGAVDAALGAEPDEHDHEHGPGCDHGHEDDDEAGGGPLAGGGDGPRIVLP